MSEPALRVAFARGVTPGKWERIWAERHPDLPLELSPVGDGEQLPALREGSAELSFVRLPVEQDGLHLIPLYEERPFVVVPRDHLLEAAESVTLSELDGQTRHPFDADIEQTLQLVAAGVGLVVVPQSIARLHSRKDLVARPVTDAPSWQIGLAWLREPRGGAGARVDIEALIEEFVGIVRGRTANSSRAASADAPAAEPERKGAGKGSTRKPGEKGAGKTGGTRSATTARRGRGPRPGGSRRRSTR